MNQYHDRSNSTSTGRAPAPPAPTSDSPPPSSTSSRPPPLRSHAATSSHRQGGGTFVGIAPEDREAFFSLLDEYFTSRPQYAEALGVKTNAAPIQAQAPAPARQAPPPVAPVRKELGKAVALYDYAGGDPEDLSLREGDSVLILEKGMFEFFVVTAYGSAR